jgi:hypothetical protein
MSKAMILRDVLLDTLEQLAGDQWPWPDGAGMDNSRGPAEVVDELEVVRPCRSAIRVTLSDGRCLTVTVRQTEPPRPRL